MCSARFNYSVYGFALSSNLPLYGLAGGNSKNTDVLVTFESSLPLGIPPNDKLIFTSAGDDPVTDSPHLLVSQDPSGVLRLCYSEGVEFAVSDSGGDIRVRLSRPDLRDDAIAYLTGPVLGYILRLRGTLALHASVVSLGQSAIAFVGTNGAGKSTTAGAFACLNHHILSDDIAALRRSTAGWVVDRGHNQVHLWPESVALLHDGDLHAPLMPGSWGKHYMEPRVGAAPEQLPLRAIYVLAASESDQAAIEPLSLREAILELLPNTFATDLLDERMRATEFQQLSDLVAEVPVKRLSRRKTPDQLIAVCNTILKDCNTLEYSL
jgi:energy-coupling factor transporter ATP-binding protein EcfA2